MNIPQYVVQKLKANPVTADPAMIAGEQNLGEIADGKTFKESEGGAFADLKGAITVLVGAAKLIEYVVQVIQWYRKRQTVLPSPEEVYEKAKTEDKLPKRMAEGDCKAIISDVIQDPPAP